MKENNWKTEKNVGANSCNSGDGTDHRIQSLMFMMKMIIIMASQSTMIYVYASDLMLKKADTSNRNKLCIRPTDVICKKMHLQWPKYTCWDVMFSLLVIQFRFIFSPLVRSAGECVLWICSQLVHGRQDTWERPNLALISWNALATRKFLALGLEPGSVLWLVWLYGLLDHISGQRATWHSCHLVHLSHEIFEPSGELT